MNPCFLDSINHDFHLQAISPCIGSGRYEDDRGALPYYHINIDSEPIIPGQFTLYPNYPNPFNGQTTISYNLPQFSDVTLTIYDVLGRKVEIISMGAQVAGRHSIEWNAGSAVSGVYFYQLVAGKYEKSARMILLK